jgi:hypothetical protein
MIPIGSVVTIHSAVYNKHYYVLDVFDNNNGDDPLLFPRTFYYKLSGTGTYWPEDRLSVVEEMVYLVTLSKDKTHFVGDFVSSDRITQEEKCAFYDWKERSVVYVGEFSDDEKQQVERILLLQ